MFKYIIIILLIFIPINKGNAEIIELQMSPSDIKIVKKILQPYYDIKNLDILEAHTIITFKCTKTNSRIFKIKCREDGIKLFYIFIGMINNKMSWIKKKNIIEIKKERMINV